MIFEDDSPRPTLWPRWSRGRSALLVGNLYSLFSLDDTSMAKRATSSHENRLLHHRLRLNLMVVDDDSLRSTLFQRWSLSSTRRRPLFSLDDTSLTKRLAKKRLLHHRLRLIFIVVEDGSLRLTLLQRWLLSSTRKRPLFSLDATSITKRKTFSHAKDCSTTDCDSTCYSSSAALDEQRFIAVVAQLYSYAAPILARRHLFDEANNVRSRKKGCSTIDCDSL